MTKRTKRLLSMLLVLVMMMTLMPVSVAAATSVTVYRNKSTDTYNGFSATVSDTTKTHWYETIYGAMVPGMDTNDLELTYYVGGSVNGTLLVDRHVRFSDTMPLGIGKAVAHFGRNTVDGDTRTETEKVQVIKNSTGEIIVSEFQVLVKAYVEPNWNYKVTYPDGTTSTEYLTKTKVDVSDTAATTAQATAEAKAVAKAESMEDAQWKYTFTGWENVDTTQITVTNAAGYEGKTVGTALITAEKKSYKITWQDEYGNELYYETLEYGATPVYDNTKGGIVIPEGQELVVDSVANVVKDATYTVKLKTKEYTITWNVDGVTSTESVKHGVLPVYSGTPAKDGWIFIGWDKTIVEATADATYTAVFEQPAVTYTVTFDANDGTGTTTTQTVGEDATPLSGNQFTRDGYRFVGWKDAAGNKYADGANITATSDITLYAQWVKTYTVSFDGNGAESGSVATKTVDTGTELNLADYKNSFKRTGYGISGWKVNGTAYGTEDKITVESDLTITAQWMSDVNGNGVADSNETFVVKTDVTNPENGKVEVSYSGNEGQVITNGEDYTAGVTYIYDSVKDASGFEVKATFTPGEDCYVTVSDVESTEAVVDSVTVTSSLTEVTFEGTFKPITVTAQVGAATSKEIKNATDLKALVKEKTNLTAEPAAVANEVSVEYQARPATPITLTYEGQSVSLTLPERWLSVDTPSSAFVAVEPNQVLKDAIGTHGLNMEAVKNEVIAKLAYYGCHEFAVNPGTGETYTENVKFVYSEGVFAATTLTITEVRDPSQVNVANNNVEFTYGEVTEAGVLSAVGVSVTDANGAALSGASVQLSKDVTALDVGTHEVTLTFPGDETYKTSSATIQITVNKAEAVIGVQSKSVKYGEAVGNVFSANCETMDFVAGLDIHDETYLTGAVQIAAPAVFVEALDAMFPDYDLSNLTIEQAKEILNFAAENYEQFGMITDQQESIDETIALLEKVQAELPMDSELVISVVSEIVMPTAVGVYITGSVSFDSNYTNAYETGYIIIYPNGIKAELAWNENDENYVITSGKLAKADLGATATVVEETKDGAELGDVQDEVEYLVLGVDDAGEIVINRVRGEEDINDVISAVGVYAQVAYIANWDNVMYYAEPIARPVIVAPNVADVAIVDASGAENYAQVYTYGEEIGMDVTVDGKSNVDGLKIKYIGSDTTADGWYRDEVPTDAGVYTVLAVYTKTDANGKLTKAGGAVGTLIIEPADAEVGLEDTTVCPDGEEHFAALTNEALDYVTIAVDRENNISYVNLPEDTADHVDRLITMLPASVEKEVLAVLDKYSEFDGDVSSETVKAELIKVLDKAIAADMTTETVDAAHKVYDKLAEEIENSEDVEALIAKIEAEAAALEEALRNEIPDELEAELEAYIRDVVSTDGTNVDIDVDAVKETVYGLIDKLKEDLPTPIAAALYVMADELVEAVESKVDVDTIKEKAEAIIEKLESLGIDDAETLVKSMIGVAAGKIDTAQMNELAETVIAKMEALGYVEYVVDLLKDVADIYDADVDVSAVKSAMKNVLSVAKAKLEEGELSEVALAEIEAAADAVLEEVKILINDLPETTLVFGENPSEEGTYDCYAMNISANYKPEFVEATLTIGHVIVVDEAVDATCTTDGLTEGQHCENCDDCTVEQVVIPALEHELGEPVIENVTATSYDEVRKCVREGCTYEEVTIVITAYEVVFPEAGGNGASAGDVVYVNGVPYELNDECVAIVEIDRLIDINLATSYSYNLASDSSKYPDHYFDVYPTEMYVWELVFVESEDSDYFKAVRIEGMDNVLQYAGASVRINGLADTNGIRMITGVPTKAKQAMIDGSMFDGTILEGYKLEEYGTIAAWEVSNVDLTLNTQGTGHAAAYKKGSMDKVFQNDGSRILYANTLTPLRDMYITKDLLVRPYLTLSNGDELVTLYGGTVQRSIGYVAYQNRATYQNGTEYYNYVWDIIEKAGGVAAFE